MPKENYRMVWDANKKKMVRKEIKRRPDALTPIRAKRTPKPPQKPLIGGRAGTAIRKATGLEALQEVLTPKKKKKKE